MFRLRARANPRFLESWRITEPEYLLRLSADNSLSSEERIEEFGRTVRQIYVGAWKTTHSNRLETSTRAIEKLLGDERDGIELLDAGASDGSTSAYTHRYLVDRGYRLQTVSTDKDPYICSQRSGLRTYYTTVNGEPFMCCIAGILMVRLYDMFNRDPVSKVIATRLRESFADIEFETPPKRIPLQNPSVGDEHDLLYEHQDIFTLKEDYRRRFDVVRCANVLNFSYFDGETILRAVDLLRQYLKPDGHFIVSKCDQTEREAGTVFEERAGALEVVERFNGGSEIEHLINPAESP